MPFMPATPYRIAVPKSAVEDLRDRLTRARWPERETVDDWRQGVPLGYLQEVCSEWRDHYDWRATEQRLNRLPQFRATIDDLGIHYVHVRSPHPHALPLVMTHGWPGSIIEFEEVIGPLTDPARYGGRAADAFHIVCPSLPGYGFSDKPATSGWGIQRIARAWATLMAGLGYRRYVAQGHDWGNSITTSLAQQDPDHVLAIHVIPPIAPPDPATFDDLTDTERQAVEALTHATRWESGYATEQSTKPQTIGYALVDSPVALCAWILEKFWTWTDGDLNELIPRQRLLDNISLYWFTATGAAAARLYWESFRQVSEWFTNEVADPLEVPTGASIFPHDVPRPSRRWAAQRYRNIIYWNELSSGGHFAALEQPNIFIEELRRCFHLVR